jgi:tetratricopeptide (TPR) repeat protein
LPEFPWAKDFAVLKEALPTFSGGRIAQLAPYAPAFETALVNAKAYFPGGALVDGKIYVLSDGPAENLLALTAAAAAAKKADAPNLPTVSVANFYPLMAMGLASYYDETGKPQDAIRVLDEGLALSVNPKAALGAHVGQMMGEKGFALGVLKRFDEGLAVYDQGLANKAVPTPEHARMQRGRGFILTETGGLDDAEAAYRASLEIEPNNPRALNELAYIAKLKAGG